MIYTWALCLLLWFILPFQLVNSEFTLYGLFIFTIFILAFVFGAKINLKTKLKYNLVTPSITRNYAVWILSFFSIVASCLFLNDFNTRNVFDLTDSFQNRNSQADALLNGIDSLSSLSFQVAFLCYPVGYIYIALMIIYRDKINILKLFFIGFLPIILASLVMGGRFPILYAFAIAFFAYRVRNYFSFELNHNHETPKKQPRKKNWITRFLILTTLLFALYYFAAVFFVRAELLGGTDIMFDFAEEMWGIKFTGLLSTFLFSILGNNFTFLLFIFSWYIVQGFVMTNILFTSYTGSMQLGIYGIDIVGAIVRRFFGEFTASNFGALLDLGTYGFLPSAFGSLYVDYGFLGIIICFIWGFWSMRVYRNCKKKNLRSIILAPFMISGIFFSLINTPFGFTNGFITYIWLGITYSLILPSFKTKLSKP